MTIVKRFVVVCLSATLLLSLPVTSLAQSSTGAIAGTVVDSARREPLNGAKVTVRGTSLETTTNALGEFRLAAVPSGAETVEVEYLGYAAASYDVSVTAGEAAAVNAVLQPVLRESIDVSDGPILQGQARALNLQKNDLTVVNIVSSSQIGRFPDPNAAEAAQRIPGITIQRDQGEGRYVFVRGTEPRLNAMTINGERIPSPEGDIRAVALDVIPADQLDAIVVTKVLTADYDADSVGGQVDLVTRIARPTPQYSATIGFGYNDIVHDGLQQLSGNVGHRFFNNRLGALVGGSFTNTDRGSQNFEVDYEDDFALNTLEVRDYVLNRKRSSGSFAVDFQRSDATSFVFNGIYNDYRDSELRRATSYAVDDGEIERELKDRLEKQRIASIAFTGSHLFGERFKLRYKTSYSYAEEREPNSYYTTFLQEDVEFAANVDPSSIDPDNIQANPLNQDFAAYLFDGQTIEQHFTSDREATGSVDVSAALPTRDGFAGFLKLGGKIRSKTKFRNNDIFDFEADDDIFLPEFGDLGRDRDDFLGGRYSVGLHVNPDLARALGSRYALESEQDFEEDAGDFKADEVVGAGYVMAELFLGPRVALLPGLRYEHTDIEYTGYSVRFDDDGDFVGTTALTGDNSYGEILPSVVARIKLDDASNIRIGVTRTLARPNYYDLVPYELIVEEDDEISRGNPRLDATTSVNFDVLGERYFSTVGLVSAGFFYKRLDDFIFPFQFEELRGEDEFDVSQPQNGQDASLWGVELAFQNRFSRLPAPFDGLGVYANYTFVDSDAELVVPGETFSRKLRLPGQAKHTGNAALTYEKYGFSGAVSWNFQGRYLEEVGADPLTDVFVDERLQLDLSASQRLSRHIRVFAELVNLNDQPFRRYRAFIQRPVQEEYYSWWATFGVKLDF